MDIQRIAKHIQQCGIGWTYSYQYHHPYLCTCFVHSTLHLRVPHIPTLREYRYEDYWYYNYVTDDNYRLKPLLGKVTPLRLDVEISGLGYIMCYLHPWVFSQYIW